MDLIEKFRAWRDRNVVGEGEAVEPALVAKPLPKLPRRRSLADRRKAERAAQTPRIQAYRAQRGLPIEAPTSYVGDDGNETVKWLPTNGRPEDLTPRQRRRVTHKRLHLLDTTEADIYG